MLSRRQVLLAGVASVAVEACSSRRSSAPADEDGSDEDGSDEFADRFAEFEVADEPNGDPTTVVWPPFVTEAGPDVQRLYEFQITHGEVTRYMPCFCGCGQTAGHRNNRDCYVAAVHPDGTVELDSMAPTWEICLGVTRDVMRMLDEGKSLREIRAAIDHTYRDQIEYSTPTPYPPT